MLLIKEEFFFIANDNVYTIKKGCLKRQPFEVKFLKFTYSFINCKVLEELSFKILIK
jgi:hypothetical protein